MRRIVVPSRSGSRVLSDRYLSLSRDGERPVAAYIAGPERLSVYLAVLLAPVATFRFSALYLTVSDLFYFLSLLLLLIAGRISLTPLGSVTSLWLLGCLLLVVGLLASSLLEGDALRGLIVASQYLFSYLLLLFILIRNNQQEAVRLAAIFLAGVVVIDLHGIITFYTVGYVPGPEKGIVSGARRLNTILGNANLAAAINALTLPTLLYFWLSHRIRARLAVPILAVMLVTVILTSSNSGIFVTCLSLILFLGSTMSHRLLLWLLTIVALSAAIMYVGGAELLPPAFHKRVLGALMTGDVTEAGSAVSRFALMEEALHQIGEMGILLIGLGADQFRAISVHEAPVHNLYLLLWVEGGMLSLIGWLLFPLTVCVLAVVIKRSTGDQYLAAATMSTAVVFLVVAFFNTHMYARHWTTPLLLALGLGLARRGGTRLA
jgi:hypothetical protein